MVSGMRVVGFIILLMVVTLGSSLNAQEVVTAEQVKQTWEKIKAGTITSEEVDLLVQGLKADETYNASIDALAGITSVEAIPFLAKHIEDENVIVRSAITTVLRGFKNKEVVPFLIKGMKDPEAIVRLNAVEGFLEFTDERAIEPLSKAVDDDNSDVRSTAISAISQYTDKRVVPALLIRKSSDAPWLDIQRVQLLGDYKDPRAISSLIVLLKLKDASVELRKNIVWALGEIGDKRAVPALEAAAKDDEAKIVRERAAVALKKIQR